MVKSMSQSAAAGQIGQLAPNFVLKDQNGENFKLSAFRGKRVLLAFLPLAWTPESADQVKLLDSNAGTFEALNAIAVGITVDSVPCKKAWTEFLGITNLRLLCDFWPHGLVCDEYEILRQMVGFSERANVIVDEIGRIVYVKKYGASEVADIQEVLKTLKALQSPGATSKE